MSKGDDQPLGVFEQPPRSFLDPDDPLFDEPTVSVPRARPGPSSLFDEPTIGIQRSRLPNRLAPEPPSVAARRSRILGDEDPTGGRGDAPTLWLAAPGAAPPFAPPGSVHPADTPTAVERLVDAAYRWRTALGLSLAGLMTLAIVVAYYGAHKGADSREAAAGSPGQTAISGPVAAPRASVDSSPSGTQQVKAEVGEVTSTAPRPLSGGSSSTTATTLRSGSTGPASSGASTTVDPGGSTAPPASDPVTTAESTPTTPTSNPTTAPSASTTSSTAVTTTKPGSTSSTPVPAAKIRVEAENGQLRGQAMVHNNREGFSGTGFVGDIVTPGNGVTLSFDVAAGGPTALRIHYSAGNTALGNANRHLTVQVNGVDGPPASMKQTADWNTWDDVNGTVELKAGRNTITIIWLRNPDNGFVNLDYIELN